MESVLASAFVGHLAIRLMSELGKQHGQQVSPTYSTWLMPSVHQRKIWWHFKVWPHLLFSSGSLRNDTEVLHNTFFFPRNVFLRNRFLTAQRDWKTSWTSVPPCPLTAAHSPSVSRRTQKADPAFTLEWGLPCQHHGYHPETGPMWKTSSWHISKVAHSSELPSTRHASPTCYAPATHSPLPPLDPFQAVIFIL